MDKLVLFDIDKTLLSCPKRHTSAFSEAFKKVYGVDTGIDIINYQGMTDKQIIMEVLKKNGLDEQTIKSKLEECSKAMIAYYFTDKSVDNDEVIKLDGVQELLEKLNKSNVLMGLVTGNLEPIGRCKLEQVGLNHYFKVGGFGSDDMDRANLVKLAIKKAKENFDFKPENNVFLFGDTPLDVKAGKEGGVKTIGVATGDYSKEQLESAGADFVLENLEDTGKILKIIFGK